MRSLLHLLVADTSLLSSGGKIFFPEELDLDVFTEDYTTFMDSISMSEEPIVGFIEIDSSAFINLSDQCDLNCKQIGAVETRSINRSVSASIQPNPFDLSFSLNVLRSGENIINIRLIDVMGKEIFTKTNFSFTDKGYLQINAISWPSGLYKVIISDSYGNPINFLNIIKS